MITRLRKGGATKSFCRELREFSTKWCEAFAKLEYLS